MGLAGAMRRAERDRGDPLYPLLLRGALEACGPPGRAKNGTLEFLSSDGFLLSDGLMSTVRP